MAGASNHWQPSWFAFQQLDAGISTAPVIVDATCRCCRFAIAYARGPKTLGSSCNIDTFCPEDGRIPVSPDPRLARRRENVPDGRPYTGGQGHIVLKSVGEEGLSGVTVSWGPADWRRRTGIGGSGGGTLVLLSSAR